MYSCYEIRIVFARCNTVSDVLKAEEAFDSIIEDGDFNEEQKRFSKMESIIRTRQIKAVNR